MPNETFQEIGTRIGALVTEKNAAYGSSFEVSAEVLKLYYPNGVSLEQMEDHGLIVRILDKVSRIVTDNDPFGEDPFGDIIGYAILGVFNRQKKRNTCSIANNAQPKSVEPEPKSSASSAPSVAPASPTTTGSEKRELTLQLPLHRGYEIILQPTATSAPVATAASAKEAVREMARGQNRLRKCAWCGYHRGSMARCYWASMLPIDFFFFCGTNCKVKFCEEIK